MILDRETRSSNREFNSVFIFQTPCRKRLVGANAFSLACITLLFSLFSSSLYAQTNESKAWLPAIFQLLMEEPEVEIPDTCTQTNGYKIIDLDHLVGVSQLPYICDGENVDDCVKDLIESALPVGCRSKIDVFVPGTNQEDGNAKQFTKLIDSEDGRGAISLGYSAANPTDTINYDRGVRKSRDVLAILLRVLKEEFVPDSVRIYGHSKGSHGVALEADRILGVEGFENYHFFAFGQAGRTATKIDDTSDMVAARLGTRGYIEKLSDNLVGITWENDEVRDFYGSGFDGLKPPLSLRYMGHIRGASTLGTGVPLYTRFDHHNTYGGDYTANSPPYCYTGSGFVMAAFTNHRCIKKVNVHFPGYFWGNTECANQSYEMLETEGAVSRVWIGTSGPRTSENSCAPKESTVTASYTLGYRHNQADVDCHLNFKVTAYGLNSPGSDDNRGNGTSFSFKRDGSIALVGGAAKRTGTIKLPYNMKLQLDLWLTRESGFGNCSSIFETETYIDYLEVSFTHPVTGQSSFKRMLIGNYEAAAYPGLIAHNQAKSPWTRTSGKWDLKYDAVYTALKIEGDTYAESETLSSSASKIRLTKEISLID